MHAQIKSNLPNPYSISQPDVDYDVFTFTTDQNFTYSCAFNQVPLLSPILGTYDIEVRDFQFYPTTPPPGVRRKHDPRVQPSLLKIIDSYLSDPTHVIVYICDDSEGKRYAMKRRQIFQEWHEQRADVYERHDLEIEIEELGITTFGGALIPRNCPHIHIVRQELIEKANEMVLEKSGY